MRRCPSCNKSYPDKTQFCPADGASLGAPDKEEGDPRVGTTIDRYRLESNLGTGGMGVVYKAEHIHLRRPVAVKLLHAHLAEDAEVVERFFREARAAGDLNNEHIVKVSDFGTFEDGAFLVMEFLPGKSLDTVLRGKPLERQRVVHIATQVADALGAAHEKGVVHRDLKPANVILVEQDGDPDFAKVLDFGIAKLLEGETKQLTKTGIVMGTPAYMAPEQASGEMVDARTDVYALGIMLYEMLGGTPPFTGENPTQVLVAHVTRPPEPLRQHNPDVPEGLERVVLSCLAKDAKARPASMAALSKALAPWAGPNPVATKAGMGAGIVAPVALSDAGVVDLGTAETVPPDLPLPDNQPAPAEPSISGMEPTMAAHATPMGTPHASTSAPTMTATGPATPAGTPNASTSAPTLTGTGPANADSVTPPTVAAPATPAGTAAPPTIPPTAQGRGVALQDSVPNTVVPAATPVGTPTTAAPSSGGLGKVLILLAVLLGLGAGAGATFWLLRGDDSKKATRVASADSDDDDDDEPLKAAATSGDASEHDDEDDEDDHGDAKDKKKKAAKDDPETDKALDDPPPATAPAGTTAAPAATTTKKRKRRSKKKRSAPAADDPPPATPPPPPPPRAAPPPRRVNPAPRPRKKPKPRVSISAVKRDYRAGKISRFQYKQRVDSLKFKRKKQLQNEVRRYKVQREALKRRYRRGLISRPQIKMLERRSKEQHKMRLRRIKETYR